jgi:cyanophycinase
MNTDERRWIALVALSVFIGVHVFAEPLAVPRLIEGTVIVHGGGKLPDAVMKTLRRWMSNEWAQPVRIVADEAEDADAIRVGLHDVTKQMPVRMSAAELATLMPRADVHLDDKVDSASRGRFTVNVPKKTALVVHGREAMVIGEREVTVYLAGPRKPNERVARHGDRIDLIALHRAAIARVEEPPYPPAVMPTPEVASGTLIMVGGGNTPRDVADAFVNAAGGYDDAQIVVIPTAAGADTYGDEVGPKFLEQLRIKHRVVHAPPGGAGDTRLLADLKWATGVWISGGRHWRLVDSYEGTSVVDGLRDVLKRGGVIAGSSAGATIQGDYLVRGDPLGSSIMMGEGYERGFCFLPGVAIDQHFNQRNRFADMEKFKQTFPQICGIGLDESTAIIVRGHIAEVLGKNDVRIYDRRDTGHVSLRAGEKYDFVTHQRVK